MPKAAAIAYKPMGITGSIAGGLLAGVIFKQVWKRVSNLPEAPEATDRRVGWREVIVAAALQGAIFAAVKAIVDRGGAEGFCRLTGEWPGEE
jgi:hypothetical protein